jgi:protein-S-isoprenylcysteine O-methyltransferase Ste14
MGSRLTSPGTWVTVLWVGWLLIWILAAIGSPRPIARESAASRVTYSVWFWAGAALLFFVNARHLGSVFGRPLSSAVPIRWLGVALIVAGLAWTLWARAHLGRMWSATVTLKSEHRLIRSGPYRLTRHPIYTGLLLALVGTVLVRGTLAGVLGFVLLVVGVILKSRREEWMLLEHLGEPYRQYQREVGMLVPGVGRLHMHTERSP